MEAFRQMGGELSLDQIESMVRTADVDSSNTIDFGEFQQMYAKLAGC